MESVKDTIISNNMFQKDDIVAVAVSGGVDSMALLEYLHQNKSQFGIEVVAVNVDHQIREESGSDSKFVIDYCKQIGVSCYSFKIDVPRIANQKKLGLEETARIARYKIFEEVIKKNLATKIAIAHHESDQVETILLNIFRGAGLKGASGMEAVQGNYVRPFLNTPKSEILSFVEENQIPHVEDETNKDTKYSRNFLRNDILPKLRQYWKNLDKNILSFSKVCKQDDEYINMQIDFDDILIDGKTARIPLYKFASPDSVQNRILKYAFQKLNLAKDIERKHLNILKNFVRDGKNGSKINLPNKLKASLNYDELVLGVGKAKKEVVPKDFKTGKTVFDNFEIVVKRTSEFDIKTPNCHIMDEKKLPKDAKWRSRQTGDVFAKFGSGEKKLKDYFIDKKIPNANRDEIPLLASGNEVFCVLGYEISERVKVDKNTKKVWRVSYKKTK